MKQKASLLPLTFSSTGGVFLSFFVFFLFLFSACQVSTADSNNYPDAGEVIVNYYLAVRSNSTTAFTLFLPVMTFEENGTIVSSLYKHLEDENATIDFAETEKGQALKLGISGNITIPWKKITFQGNHFFDIIPTLVKKRKPTEPFSDEHN